MTPRVELVAIGASLGGLAALQTLLRGLPAQLGASLAIAQHRRADPESRLAWLLGRTGALPVTEPEDKTPLEVDHAYLAPSDYHLLIERGSPAMAGERRGFAALSIDAPVRFARPSIDVLFESVADAYGPAAVGVMLTSSNEDGAEGLRAIVNAGGRAIVQDPGTAESPIGPLAALAATRVDAVLTLEQIAPALVELCSAPRELARVPRIAQER